MTIRIAEVARRLLLADRAVASPAERADLVAAICERIACVTTSAHPCACRAIP